MAVMDTDDLHGALLAALERAGGNQSHFSREIGISQQRFAYWLKARKALPAEFVLAAEAAGLGTRHELRPDLYPLDEHTKAEAA